MATTKLPPTTYLECLNYVTNNKQMISHFRQYSIPRVHKVRTVRKSVAKKTLFLPVQVTVNVRWAYNPSKWNRLEPACWLNARWTLIGRNCMLFVVFPLPDWASCHIHVVFMHCFEPQYLYQVNIVALRLRMSLIWQTCITWVRHPGKCVADKAGGKGDGSDNVNAGRSSCSMFDLDSMPLSSVFEMCATAAINWFSAPDSFWVEWKIWQPSYIFNMSWTLPILFNFLFSTSLLISKSFSDFVLLKDASSPASILWLREAYCLAMTCLWWVLPVVFDYHHRIIPCQGDILASTPKPCGMIVDVLCATLERSVHFSCSSSWWRHQSVISRICNVLLISMGSEW